MIRKLKSEVVIDERNEYSAIWSFLKILKLSLPVFTLVALLFKI
jgi:hypothetical protein